jgi:hypothetical protein
VFGYGVGGHAEGPAGALCVTLCAVTGITNRSLRALMTELLGAPYSMAQAGYALGVPSADVTGSIMEGH